MRKLLIASAALVALGCGSASAQPPPPPMWNWTGFYVGVNAGYSWGRSATDVTLYDAVTGAALATLSQTLHLNGGLGGGQIGWNWQSANLVWGVEADIQATGQRGSATFFCPAATCGPAGGFDVTVDLTQKLSWFGTLRGRLGLTVTPTVIAYVTGGLAYGEVRTDGTISGLNANGAPTSTAFSASSTKAGWALGTGVEAVISGPWTAKIEFLHIDLGTVSGGPFATTISPPVRADFLSASFRSRVTDNILRAGLNLRF